MSRTTICVVAMWLLASAAGAQRAGTTTQIELIDEYAELQVHSVRYGPQHPVILAHRARLERLREALGAEPRIAFRQVKASLRARIARTNAELRRLETRYGPAHPALEQARTRRVAWSVALARIERGEPFLP